MDDFEVRQILNDLQFNVRNFKKHRNKDEWNFSCDVCGDSKVKTRAARFGVARKQGVWVCHCFNCGYSNTLVSYLKDFHRPLYERITVNTFLQQNPDLYSLDHLFEKVNDKTLCHLFFINKLSDVKYWFDYLDSKKITLKEKNLRKLYALHKEHWK